MSFPLDEYFLTGDPHPGIRGLPGWQVLTPDETQLLVAAGKLFLGTERPYAFRGLRAGGPTRNSAAAYRLLRELATLDPTYLEDLPATSWERWIPAIILFQCDLPDKQFGDEDRKLLILAAAKATVCLTRALGIALRQPKLYGAERQMQRMANVLGCDALDANIFKSLLHRRVTPSTYLSGMRRFIECSYLQVKPILRGGATTGSVRVR